MIGKVSAYIREQRLLSDEGLHLVALSGGTDSVALLLLLRRLGYRVEAMHCNFHLRGDESDRDEAFCQQLCDTHDIPLHRAHFDTREYAALHHQSIEMAARELRYHYFHQLLHDLDGTSICVAHHRDDSVETLLMNLMRGAGIHGLTGIRPRNGQVVRPLLCVSKAEIVAWLDSIGQTYVTDSTNLSPDEALRNKIRLQLLPLMEQIQPGTTANLARTSYYISEAEKVYNAALAIPKNEVTLSDLQTAPSPLSLLHEWLSPLGFNRTQIADILAHSIDPQGQEFSSSSHSLIIDRGRLLLEPILSPMKPLKIPETGTYLLDANRRIRVEESDTISISKSADCATLDAALVEFPLTVRPLQPGDRFHPFGMRGTRLVSDFLTDRKCSQHEKRRQLVVTQSDGEIIWLVGHRTDHRFRITEATGRVLRLSLL